MLYLDFTKKGKASFNTKTAKEEQNPGVAPIIQPPIEPIAVNAVAPIIVKEATKVIAGDVLSKPITLKPKTVPQNNIRFVI